MDKPAVVPAKNPLEAKASIIRDDTGYPVPPKAMACWNRREFVKELMLRVSQLKTWSHNAARDRDILFSEVNLNALTLELDSVDARIRLALPYAVCPTCQGRLVETCTTCNKRGVISKFKYDRGISADVKKARSAV